MSTTYTVSVTRDGEWWMVAVPELDALTQARRLGDVDTAARELVALETGTAVDEVSIDVHVELAAARVPVRDIATLLGVTFHRVSRLVDT